MSISVRKSQNTEHGIQVWPPWEKLIEYACTNYAASKNTPESVLIEHFRTESVLQRELMQFGAHEENNSWYGGSIIFPNQEALAGFVLAWS